MGKASISALVGFVTLAGCGTLLGIQPDESPPSPSDDGGMPVSDGSSTEAAAPVDGAGADAADAADGASGLAPCLTTPQAPPCVLAEGLVNLGSIAVGNGNVYFTRHESLGAVLQIPSTGGPVTSFASSMLPAGLSATPTALYWVTEGDNQVVRQDFTTNITVGSVNGASSPAAQIVGVGSETFWTVPGVGANAGQLRASSTFNAGAALVTNADQPTAIAADATYVYYATNTAAGHVARMMHNGTAMTTETAAFRGINAIALSAGIVAITSLDGVYRASTQTNTDFISPWVQVSSNATGVGLVADAVTGTLYVLAANGGLEVIPNVASPPITSINVASCAAGTAIAQGGAHVYLACKDRIVRVSK